MPDTRPVLKFLLSPRNLKLLALAFGAGLLMFLFLWLDQRNDTDFFKASTTSATSGEDVGLPVPLPADVASDDHNKTGLSLPPTGQPQQVLAAGDQPRIVEPVSPVAPALPSRDSPAISGNHTSPVPTNRPPPVYPREAMRRGIGGSVRVQATVAPDGSVERMDVAQSSGNRDLDRAAMEAVRRWRFTPAMRNGQPVSETVVIPVDFSP